VDVFSEPLSSNGRKHTNLPTHKMLGRIYGLGSREGLWCDDIVTRSAEHRNRGTVVAKDLGKGRFCGNGYLQ
jgi:hypothetical protein